MNREPPTTTSKARVIKAEHMQVWVDHIEQEPILSEPRTPRSVETGRRTIAYYKIGRSMLLSPKQWGPVGGDNEGLHMLVELANRHPDVNWVVAGRNGGDPGDLPANVIVPEIPNGLKIQETMEMFNYMYTRADGALIWLGQHGTSNMPTPQIDHFEKYTFPLDESLIYVGPVIDALNRVGPPEDGGYEPVWLCADVRNYLKARDPKWYPYVPVLGQYDFSRKQRHYRWGDPRSPQECIRDGVSKEIKNGHWQTEHSYMYSGLELTGIPRWEDESWPDFEDRVRFGMIVNETRAYVNPAMTRLNAMKEYVLPLEPDFVHGKWSDKSQEALGTDFQPIHYTEMNNVAATARCTFTTPASGSEWATAKPWEMFALGIVCFFHPKYDGQGHIIPLEDADFDDPEHAALTDWLRVSSPEDLKQKVDAVSSSKETYEWLRDAQLRLLRRRRDEDLCLRMIEQRLGLCSE